MKIAMFTRYGPLGANSRYRLMQYIPLLQRAGHQVEVCPMLDDAYLRTLYRSQRRSRWQLVRGYLRRLAQLRGLGQFDLVVCDQEFLPYFPPMAERWAAARCARLVVDYDDAAWCKYQRLPLLAHRIPALMAHAEAVVAGNRNLAAYASRFHRNVHVIPTVVDVARYSPRRQYSSPGGVRLVWIGTPVTARFLREIAPVLRALKARYPSLGVRLIGAGAAMRDELPFAEVIDWSEATEAQRIGECDIGIMPLPDDEFARGKCGLKLIQSMAAGLPVVASPVGANCEIVAAGEDGFLAADPSQWFASLEALILSAQLRERLGRNAALKARRLYSLEAGFAAWRRVLEARPAEPRTASPSFDPASPSFDSAGPSFEEARR